MIQTCPTNQPQLLVKELKHKGQVGTLSSHFCQCGKKKKEKKGKKEKKTQPGFPLPWELGWQPWLLLQAEF